MDVQLVRAGTQDAERFWEMQLESFAEMYWFFRDTETSPGAERGKAACPIPALHKGRNTTQKAAPSGAAFPYSYVLAKTQPIWNV